MLKKSCASTKNDKHYPTQTATKLIISKENNLLNIISKHESSSSIFILKGMSPYKFQFNHSKRRQNPYEHTYNN